MNIYIYNARIDFLKKYEIPKGCWNHAKIFLKNIFCVIAGTTGCGKTNLMVHLLLQKNKINYSDVYIYSPTLHQPAYIYLKNAYELKEQILKNNTKQSVEIAHFCDPAEKQLINPVELERKHNHVMIFDDIMLENQIWIKKYFCSNRHNNVNVFYLVQSPHKITKYCIIENANIFILFKQDNKTLKYFHETHISGDIDFEELKLFCDNAWMEKHGFVVFNLWDNAYCGRYWDNYTHVYIPSKYK